ncbi:olfactory receptor 2J3-like [Hemicordylus capensis]|uniref:olfactory receptor 2J3-like n=1 Tax=Hemicordylus capensis TaxID=884348 RepID=UPI002304260D|nr:olfactory receptor 2J3-like [Hemicordylus capensis]
MELGNFTTVTEFILVGLPNHRKTQLLLFVMILIIYLLTIVGNLIIILLVQTDSRLHTPMYFFLTQLSGVEICYVTSTLPQMMVHLLAGNGTITFTHCAAQMYMILSMGSAECFLLGVMAYDRYLAICRPLLYAVAMNRWCQMELAVACWAGAFLCSVIYMGCTYCHPFCGPNHINHFICELPVVLKLACADTHLTEAIIFWEAAMILLGPLFVILTSYGLILSSVLKMRTTAGRQKVFTTCASHLLVVTVFYGTVGAVYMVPQSGTAPDHGKQISVFYIVITPLLNPIIYTLRNKDVHGAVTRLLQRQRVG